MDVQWFRKWTLSEFEWLCRNEIPIPSLFYVRTSTVESFSIARMYYYNYYQRYLSDYYCKIWTHLTSIVYQVESMTTVHYAVHTITLFALSSNWSLSIMHNYAFCSQVISNYKLQIRISQVNLNYPHVGRYKLTWHRGQGHSCLLSVSVAAISKSHYFKWLDCTVGVCYVIKLYCHRVLERIEWSFLQQQALINY